MQLQNFRLVDFRSGVYTPEYTLNVPSKSKFLKFTVNDEGIFAWYLTPMIEDHALTKVVKFRIVSPKENIDPDIYEFIDIIEQVLEDPEGNIKLTAYPIFKRR